jgi:molybdate transport system substrate-binding protein
MNRRSWIALFAFVTTQVTGCLQAHPKQVLVFAAASTADAVTELGKAFQAEQGSVVRASFGSSRDLARQIQAGAPADVFLSADAETMDALIEGGQVRAEDKRVLMSNRLVVIVPREEALTVGSATDLKKAKHLALGDPTSVPAGKYAKKWLEKAGVWESVQPQVVPMLDVRAALAAVESGQADVGVVYRTDATTSQRVRIAYEVPVEMSPVITYVIARVRASVSPKASEFVDFLTGPRARTTLQRYGFVL